MHLTIGARVHPRGRYDGEPDEGRLLALGFLASLIAVGLSAGVAALTGWFDWQGVSISGLILICLAVLLQTVRPDSQMPGFASGHEMYIETAGR